MFRYESIPLYHDQLRRGQATCASTVEHFLQIIQQKKHLNAFVHVYAHEAFERASQLDARRSSGAPLGPLHGVVVALKDVICYKDHPVSASSKILRRFIAPYHATAVKKLLDAEAIIIGHTNCDEFAMGSTNENSAYGPVLNDYDNSRVSGGSSGGSAVAVQAGCCMVSLGSDTGGSVRQPADFCGVMGLKPTYGRISRYGLIAYASSFDQIGIFGRSAQDIEIVLSVIQGDDRLDSTVRADIHPEIEAAIDRPMRIAYFNQALNSPALDPQIKKTLTKFLRDQELAGHQVSGIDFKYLDYIVPAYYVLTTAEASSNLSRYDGVKFGFRDQNVADLGSMYESTRSHGFGTEVKRRIMLGTFVLSAGYYDAYFTKAQQIRRLLSETTNDIFRQYDLLILPTSPEPPFKLGEKLKDPVSMYLADIFTVFANLTGIPAISIPLFWHDNGLPLGLQVMTPRFSDLSLLRVAHLWMTQSNPSKTTSA